jgi:hypothetical protein
MPESEWDKALSALNQKSKAQPPTVLLPIKPPILTGKRSRPGCRQKAVLPNGETIDRAEEKLQARRDRTDCSDLNAGAAGGLASDAEEKSARLSENGEMPVEQGSKRPKVRAAERTVMVGDIAEKHILDTSAWNKLFEDPARALLIEKLDTKNIVPTAVAISEVSATEDREDRIGLLSLMKALGKD